MQLLDYTMGIRSGYLIFLVLLPMLTAGKVVQQSQHQQQLEKWQLEQLELQHTRSESKHADNDNGPWIHITSAVLHLQPDEQPQLLLLQAQEASHSTTLPCHHLHGHEVAHEPHHSVSDNLDFQHTKTQGR